MNDERLEQLLRHADTDVRASSPSSTLPPRGLADAVRQRHRRRQARRTRAIAGVAIVGACVGLSGLLLSERHTRQDAQSTQVKTIPPAAVEPTTTPAIDPERAGAEFRRLVAEADRREAFAARLQNVSPSLRARSRSIELQREEATILLLHQGDTLARDPAMRESAAVAYRQAVDLFPETSAAAAAKLRLDALN